MATKPVLVIDGNVVGDITEQAVEDSVSVTADGSKTYSTLLNELYSQIDISKITEHTVIYKGDDNFWFNLSRMESDNTLHFGSVMNYGSYFRNFAIEINASASKYMRLDVQGGSNNTITNNSTSTPASGTEIILYYGSDSIKADFETHANKCMMTNGNSIEDEIDALVTSHGVDILLPSQSFTSPFTYTATKKGVIYAYVGFVNKATCVLSVNNNDIGTFGNPWDGGGNRVDCITIPVNKNDVVKLTLYNGSSGNYGVFNNIKLVY